MNDITSIDIHCSSSLSETYTAFEHTEGYRSYPLQVRTAFRQIFDWLVPNERAISLKNVDARFARRIQRRAARERGWRFGNISLKLLQEIVALAVKNEAIEQNRVRNVPKLPPPQRSDRDRRRIVSMR